MGEVLDGDAEQCANVVVVESIVDVATVAPVSNDPGGSQQTERLGDLGLAGADGAGDLVHTQFVGVGERLQDANSGRVAEQPKQRSGLVRKRLYL